MPVHEGHSIMTVRYNITRQWEFFSFIIILWDMTIDIFLKKIDKWLTGIWKTTMRFHLFRMSGIKETRDNKCWWEYGEIRTFLHCWCKLVQPLWKIVWRFFKKLKIELPYDPAIPVPGIYPKEINSVPQRDLHFCVHCSIIHSIAKIWKWPTMVWMDEEVIHTHIRVLLSLKKQGNISICNKMDELGEYCTKWNKLDPDKNCKISLICGF